MFWNCVNLERTETTTAKPAVAAQIVLISILCFEVFSARPLAAEVSVKFPPLIFGRVEYVDESALMHLTDVSINNGYPYLPENIIKIFGLNIDQMALSAITSGRQVICRYIYSTDSYVSAACSVERFWSTNPAGNIGYGSVNEISEALKLGTYQCNPEEAAQSENVSSERLRSLCNNQ